MAFVTLTFVDRVRLAMEARGIGPVALDDKLGKGLGTVSTMLGRNSVPKVDTAVALAKALGVRLDWLATGEGPMEPVAVPFDHEAPSSGERPLTFKDLPGWAAAVKKARARYRRIPEVAWIGAGQMAAANVTENIDEAVVLSFAQAWLTGSTDEARAAAAEEEARLAMAEEDAAYAQKLLKFENPPPPKPRKKRTPKSKPAAE